MSRRRIVRRPAAANDLAEQAAWYITHAGQEVADRFLAAAKRTAEELLRAPEIGPHREHLNPALKGLRMFPVQGFDRHLIFYRPTEAGIELVRVLHASRDVATIIAAEPSAGDGK
jgi:toxin ParE1/3/4